MKFKNMAKGIRLIAQCYDVKTGEIEEESVLKDEVLKKAETLKQLGYLHIEQIDLIQKVQDFKVKHQIVLSGVTQCPQCHSKTIKQGLFKSKFFSALTDHKVMVQRTKCRCGWTSPISIEGIFGSYIHPDLLEKQALQGCKESYEKSSKSLNAESAGCRSVNSHSQIYKTVKCVGALLEEIKSSDAYCSNDNVETETLIANIDGGHIKAKGANRSFEAMVAKVYNPENIESVNNNRKKISAKTYAASAKDDEQTAMKLLFKNACIAQGMTKNTRITCLADGASNCWSIANSIKADCKSMDFILDWFHISMKFNNIAVLEEEAETFERAKWNLWHGKHKESIALLAELKGNTKDRSQLIKFNKLIQYIENNKEHIVDYDERKRLRLVFTSNESESTVNSLINDRQKGKQKMLWSRDGAHNVLQIRTSLFSSSWKNDWEKVEKRIYKIAA
jgi:hypothetical protein